VTLGIGAILGLVAAVLLGREFRRDESWGILLGTALLAAGLSARLGLSVVGTTFALGLTLTLVSRHASDLKGMVAASERPVMLPVTLLAGLLVEIDLGRDALAFVGAGMAARLLMELVRGFCLASASRAARPAGALVGFALLPSGPYTLGAAAVISFALPAPLGARVLLLAAGSLLAGELVGPLSLWRALVRAREIVPGRSVATAERMPPSVPPPASERR
jgi:hypothetical protein